MSVEDASRIAKIIAEIQYELREDLLRLLTGQEKELRSVLDPRTFSPEFEEVRDKYLDKLAILQGIVNELANFGLSHTKRITRIESLCADSHEKLTRMVNMKLARLEGCRIVDVEFIKNENDGKPEWVSFITYVPNPLTPPAPKQPSKT
jgi:hypothetical protein